jgi:hypothetical protein
MHHRSEQCDTPCLMCCCKWDRNKVKKGRDTQEDLHVRHHKGRSDHTAGKRWKYGTQRRISRGGKQQRGACVCSDRLDNKIFVRSKDFDTCTRSQLTRQRWSNCTVVGFSKMLRHQVSEPSGFFAYADENNSSAGGARRPPMSGNSL